MHYILFCFTHSFINIHIEKYNIYCMFLLIYLQSTNPTYKSGKDKVKYDKDKEPPMV